MGFGFLFLFCLGFVLLWVFSFMFFNQSINYTWVPIREQLKLAPYNTRQPKLASAGLNGPCCVDQTFPNCHVLGIVPKCVDLFGCMEVSTPHCGCGSYIIPTPLLDRCWRPPPTPLALKKFALKNLHQIS